MSTYDEWKTRTPDEGGPSPDERHELAAAGVERCGCGLMMSRGPRLCVCDNCLENLAANLAVAGGLEWSWALASLTAGQWMARDPMWPSWGPGERMPPPSYAEFVKLSAAMVARLKACGWPAPLEPGHALRPATGRGEGE